LKFDFPTNQSAETEAKFLLGAPFNFSERSDKIGKLEDIEANLLG